MMGTERQGGFLEVVRAGIDTYQEPVVYMREDCSVCRSEGFEAQARINEPSRPGELDEPYSSEDLR